MNYAIVLAAGKGSRMKSDLPKCGIPILGKPMISYIVKEIKKTIIDEIICVVGHKKEYIFNVLNDSVSYRIQAFQRGSGDAVMACKGIDEDGYTIILNGDMPLIDYDLIQKMIDYHLKHSNDLTIGTFYKNDAYGYGRIVRDNNDSVIEIVEQADLKNNQGNIKEVNAGIYCIRTSLLFSALAGINNHNLKNEYYLTDIVKQLSGYKINSFIIEESDKVLGANTLYELAIAEDIMRMKVIKKHLNNGVRIEGINSVFISDDVIIEKGCVIKGSTILGNTMIHSGCVIKDSEINNCIIFNDSIISHSVISDSIVGINCSVGPFAHIRGNSMISGDNRVGNFVEIKNSKLGVNSKISHLGYMGDTSCGNNVNFGCGSITVNYDGKAKHKTNIGDNVFIGCNSNLIAPIDIESNSYIAAGSTITNSLDQGDFAIARSKQVTKKGYASKYE